MRLRESKGVRFLSFLLAFVLFFSFTFTVGPASAAESRTLRLIGTSDIHGQIQNWDYFSDTAITSSKRGMAKICTYVNQVRAANPYTLVIDNGDTIQGTPVNYLYNVLRPTDPNPMAVAMNYIGYDAMTLGNHEFNFGQTVLGKFISEASFPVLAANVRKTADNTPAYTPYTIKDIGGVQVGILGLTNQAIPHWEKPENIAGLSFTDPVAEANTYVPQMRAAGADVIVIAAHSGTDVTYGYGHEENFILDLANNVSGVDVILAGHAHVVVNTTVNGVLIVAPRNAGRDVCDVTLNLTGSGSDWTVSSKSGVVQSMDAVAEDSGFLATMQPYHDATRTYVNTPVGEALGPFPGGFPARIQDGPTADLINLVQTEAAAAAGYPVDASCAALFTDAAQLAQGPIRLKDIYGLYIYDNTLYVVEATGQIVKDVLEWTAQYFNTYDFSPTGVTKNPAVRDYNYDMWSGIQYKIDITKPPGQRIFDLKLNGVPISMSQKIRVAVNNYRATGQFVPRGATVLYSSTTEVRDLIVQWVEAHSPLDPNAIFIKNWSLYPDNFLRPNEVITKDSYLALLGLAFGEPSEKTYLFADPSRKTAIVVDVSNKKFQFFAGEKTYGVRSASRIFATSSVLKFSYSANDLFVNANLSLKGGPSNVTVLDKKTGKRYLLLSRDLPTAFDAERAQVFLVNQAMSGIVSPSVDWTLLDDFGDYKSISPWSASAYTYSIQIGLFYGQSSLNPKAALTNWTALQWISETRYPSLTVLSTNDFHGQLEPKTVSGQWAGGAAYNMTYIKNYRAQNPLGTILVDAGDTMQGTPISNLVKGESVIDVFNHMGYQASAFGNHEFDWGQAVLQERVAQADFPRLSCNIFTAGTNDRPSWIKPYTIIQAKGLKIGLIGATTLETPSIVMAGNLAGLEFRDPAPIINQLAQQLRASGVNVIIVLAHMGGTQDTTTKVITGEVATLAQNLTGVDYIVSGHSHTNIAGTANSIPITQAYSSGTALGVAKLRVDRLNNKLFSYDLSVITTYNAGITPDPEIAALVQYYKDAIAPIVNQVLGTITGPITRTQNTAGESALGNLIADSQRWKTGTQIAFMNPGGIRADLVGTSYPKDVTWGDLYTIQPFDNELVTMELTGAQIAALLEQQWPPTQTATRTLQISGIKYSYRPTNPPGSRIVSLTLEDGTPIDPATKYSVVCNEFIATGGDKFTVFLQGTNVQRTAIRDLTAFIDYILWKFGTPPANTPITAAIEGRITIAP
ncbi:MAG: 5'-nucleotidase C-terminal domain-containing protein [Caldiserica bacterium]|nr:5'-nucleotidase C-terminal domain-containing protein [Caldisericota bacterium]